MRTIHTSRHLALAAFMLVAGFAPVRPAAQSDAAAMIGRIESAQVPDRQGFDALTLVQVMQRLRVPGASVAVVKDFQVHWAKAYGVADVASGRAVDPSTRFQAASISKPVTAMAGVRLAQDRRLDLDADVNTLLKSWQVPASDYTRGHPVTPRALFSHTSGADDGFGFPGYDPAAPRPALVQILKGEAPSNVGPVLFARPPFRGYKYSGGGVTIMQLAIAELTGRPFAEFMQAIVLGPLKMTSSSFAQPPPPDVAAQLARAHDGQGRAMNTAWHVYPEQAAAGLWTTPTDLARFIIEVQTAVRGPAGAVLSQASAREMTSPVGVGPYAVGLAVDQRGEGWYFSHGGSNWGFQADLVGHLRKGYGVAIMTNGDRGRALITEIEARVAAAYGWDTLDKPLVR
ncbi:MAG TPA: serine hydrolase domain-containing protein [Vicinamibacterales bacterium]|nr:serine hydrolase domain-containing protein [Vicinamibacterales bacterium]